MNKIPKAPVKIPLPYSENIGCPNCGDEIGIESEMETERSEQRDFDHDYYTEKAEELVAQARQIAYEEVEEWLVDTPYRGFSLLLAFREKFLPGEVKK